MASFTPGSFILPKILKVIGVVFLSALLGIYVVYQARNIIQGPSIVLTGTYESVQHEKSITITGHTYNIVKLTVNGKEIHTSADGAFSHELVLENGYTIASFNAQDRFGRTTSLMREYVYVPPETADGV